MTPDRRTCPICNGTGWQEHKSALGTILIRCPCFLGIDHMLGHERDVLDSYTTTGMIAGGLVPPDMKMAPGTEDYFAPKIKTTPIPDSKAVTDTITDTHIEEFLDE